MHPRSFSRLKSLESRGCSEFYNAMWAVTLRWGLIMGLTNSCEAVYTPAINFSRQLNGF